jgi:hypothetical protein
MTVTAELEKSLCDNYQLSLTTAMIGFFDQLSVESARISCQLRRPLIVDQWVGIGNQLSQTFCQHHVLFKVLRMKLYRS